MSKRTRTPPSELVASAKRCACVSWYDALSNEDRDYVNAVVNAMRATPSAGIKPVAEKLRRELQLSVVHGTVAVKLRELLSEKT
jgi:hypothetical protein